MSTICTNERPTLSTIPPEVRLNIYREMIAGSETPPSDAQTSQSHNNKIMSIRNLMLTNKKIYNEVRHALWSNASVNIDMWASRPHQYMITALGHRSRIELDSLAAFFNGITLHEIKLSIGMLALLVDGENVVARMNSALEVLHHDQAAANFNSYLMACLQHAENIGCLTLQLCGNCLCSYGQFRRMVKSVDVFENLDSIGKNEMVVSCKARHLDDQEKQELLEALKEMGDKQAVSSFNTTPHRSTKVYVRSAGFQSYAEPESCSFGSCNSGLIYPLFRITSSFNDFDRLDQIQLTDDLLQIHSSATILHPERAVEGFKKIELPTAQIIPDHRTSTFKNGT